MGIPGPVSELLDVLVELAAANIQKKTGEHERNTERIVCAGRPFRQVTKRP